MLGKLIKYEFKETYLPMVIGYGALLITALILKLMPRDSAQNQFLSGLSNFIGGVYAIIFVVLFVITLIVILRRFHVSLLSSEGYFNFSLPVRASEHIGAKLIVGIIYNCATGAAAFLSIAIMTGSEQFGVMISEISKLLSDAQGQFTPVIVESILFVLIGIAVMILIFYFSMSIAQLFDHHRVLASILTFFAVSIVINIIFSVGLYGIINNIVNSVTFDIKMVENILGSSILLNAGIGAVLFFVTDWLLSKHLNLE